MITYKNRGGQARRAFDAATMAGVPLRRAATCKRCKGAGEVASWTSDGSICGEFLGMVPCSCPAAAALEAAQDDETIAAAGGAPAAWEDWMAV